MADTSQRYMLRFLLTEEGGKRKIIGRQTEPHPGLPPTGHEFQVAPGVTLPIMRHVHVPMDGVGEIPVVQLRFREVSADLVDMLLGQKPDDDEVLIAWQPYQAPQLAAAA